MSKTMRFAMLSAESTRGAHVRTGQRTIGSLNSRQFFRSQQLLPILTTTKITVCRCRRKVRVLRLLRRMLYRHAALLLSQLGSLCLAILDSVDLDLILDFDFLG
jgi:hypothetical protein